MTTVSISQLKAKPSKIISLALDYPVAVAKRSQIKAYLLGKTLYDKLVSFIEDYIDRKAVASADLRHGRDFEKVAKKLGL